MLSPKSFLLHGILQLLFLHQAFADTLTVTIVSSPTFLAQRSCAIYCYVNSFDAVLNPFGCPSNPLENSCWCRDDLMSSAGNSISTCVSKSCSGNSIDVQSATSIYTSYCSQNNFFAVTPTAGSGGNSQGAATAQGASTATQTAGGTDNGNSGNGNSGNGGGNATCGNGVTNVSGVNIVCGAKNEGGLSAADQRSLALTLGLGLGLPALLITFLSLYI